MSRVDDQLADLGQQFFLDTLERIEIADKLGDYEGRNRLVYRAVYYAIDRGLPAGYRVDPAEPEWPVAYIELPTGQVCWHLPQHLHAWDGHDTDEKYRRSRAYIAQQRAST